MLHTVNKSPFDKTTLEACLRLSQAGSAVLMIEDGVYGALKGTRAEGMVKAALQDREVYVLGPDLEARGMRADAVIEGIKVVDYGGFVDLVAEKNTVQSWL